MKWPYKPYYFLPCNFLHDKVYMIICERVKKTSDFFVILQQNENKTYNQIRLNKVVIFKKRENYWPFYKCHDLKWGRNFSYCRRQTLKALQAYLISFNFIYE